MTTKGQELSGEVSALLRARNPILWVITKEEARVEKLLAEAAMRVDFIPRTWDVAQGALELNGQPVNGMRDTEDAGEMLTTILQRANGTKPGNRCVWIMRDLPAWLEGGIGITPLRRLRNIARLLPTCDRSIAQAIIILTPSDRIPPELAGHTTVIDWPLPDRAEIAAILDASIGALPEYYDGDDGKPEVGRPCRALACPNGTREKAIDAAVGLSGEEASATFSKSLVQRQRTIVPEVVAKEKKRVIGSNTALEWYDPIPGGLAAVGGLENLKTWLGARASAYSIKAREYGLPMPRGTLLAGITGCLTGDTLINVCRKQRTGGYKSIRLDALFYRFNDLHDEGVGLGLYSNKKWDLTVKTRCHCYLEDKQYIGFNEIEGVVFSGVKEVFILATDHGNEIKATADHEFLTTRGYVRLGDLLPGDDLYAHGQGVLVDSNATGRNANKAIRHINNVGNHPFARRRSVNGLEYSSHPLHRLVIEAHMNNMRLEDFLWALHGDTTGLKFMDESLEGHHMDGDRDNNTRGNLEPLTKGDHARLHINMNNTMNKHRYGPRLQKVASIQRVGNMPTYDIRMKTPNHNFVANGLVVHNCGKSLTAKAISTAWGVPLLKLDMGALKSKFVGESEGNLRKAFAVIKAVGRCVVWIDEIEKALAGATGGGADGGVSADALGGLLTWMQERSSEAFLIATANDITGLPPEFLRKGRWDEIWWVDLPRPTERLEILAAALREHGRSISAVKPAEDIARIIARCDGYTGSEIAAIVPDAMYAAFADGAREITAADLYASAQSITPISVTMAEKIKKMREWATGRTRAATPKEDGPVVEVTGGRKIDA